MGMRDCEVGWVGVRFFRKRERERERERGCKDGIFGVLSVFCVQRFSEGKVCVFWVLGERESESEVFTEFNHF